MGGSGDGMDECFGGMYIEGIGFRFGLGFGSAWVGSVASMGTEGMFFAWRECVRMGLGGRKVVAGSAAWLGPAWMSTECLGLAGTGSAIAGPACLRSECTGSACPDLAWKDSGALGIR